MSKDTFKCVILHGCEVPDESIHKIIKFFEPRYYDNGQLTDDFFTDIDKGVSMFTKNNMYELNRYKTNWFPPEETYFLSLNKLVIPVIETGNIKVLIGKPTDSDIKEFNDYFKGASLTYNQFVIITK